VLLMLSVAVNGTQAVVLCTGPDGHVAIELAGHQHCQSHHGSEETAHETEALAAEQEAGRGPCVDIPLSPGMADGPGVQKTPATIALFAGIALSIPGRADHGPETCAAAGASLSFTSFYDPLSSIILIV
jgi:hypothetical protein